MKFKHTHRPGFLLGFIDFFTAGLFFLFYMPYGGLEDELEYILGHKVQPYWQAYVLGIPTLFIYPLIWMAGISEELKEKAIEMGVEGPYTSWWHMFGWNILGLPLMGPAVATHRFFGTLNKIERKLNRKLLFSKNNINKGLAEYESTPGAVLVDVREASEYASGYIPGAVNMPLSLMKLTTLPKDKPLFLYCLRGARSKRAEKILRSMGYGNVRSIGGIKGYKGKLVRYKQI